MKLAQNERGLHPVGRLECTRMVQRGLCVCVGVHVGVFIEFIIRNLCMRKCEIFMQSVYTPWSYPRKQLSAEAAIA